MKLKWYFDIYLSLHHTYFHFDVKYFSLQENRHAQQSDQTAGFIDAENTIVTCNRNPDEYFQVISILLISFST